MKRHQPIGLARVFRLLGGAACVLTFAACQAILGYDDLSFTPQGPADATLPDVSVPDVATIDAFADAVTDGRADGGDAAAVDATVVADGGPPACTRTSCAANAYCDDATKKCACDPGFATNGGDCRPTPPVAPGTHADADVCQRYAATSADVPGDAWTGASVPACDPGAISVGDEVAVLRRAQFFRWLVGVAPLPVDESRAPVFQRCAMAVANNPAAGSFIPVVGACRTPDGAAAAATSLISVGLGGKPADAVDRWIQDADADRSLEDRRALLSPALGPTALGYYAGGTNGADGICFASDLLANTGTKPDWYAFPPPGPFPAAYAQWGFSFHGPKSVQNLQLVVTKKGGAAVPVDRFPLVSGQDGYNAILYKPLANLEVGATYVVTVTNYDAAPIVWETKPIACP
jgi:hypothetical protein